MIFNSFYSYQPLFRIASLLFQKARMGHVPYVIRALLHHPMPSPEMQIDTPAGEPDLRELRTLQLGGRLAHSIQGIIFSGLLDKRLPETILRRILALLLRAVALFLILRRVI